MSKRPFLHFLLDLRWGSLAQRKFWPVASLESSRAWGLGSSSSRGYSQVTKGDAHLHRVFWSLGCFKELPPTLTPISSPHPLPPQPCGPPCFPTVGCTPWQWKTGDSGEGTQGGYNLEITKEYMLLNTSAVIAVADVMKFNHNSQQWEKGVEKGKQKSHMCMLLGHWCSSVLISVTFPRHIFLVPSSHHSSREDKKQNKSYFGTETTGQ